MGYKKICNMDCLNCIYDDCINDCVETRSEKKPFRDLPEEQRVKLIAYQMGRYRKAKAEGLCTGCKKKAATHGLKCYECWLKQKRYRQMHAEHNRERWREEGRCFFCGAPAVQGKNTCEKHYQIYVGQAERARSQRTRHHPAISGGIGRG